ncbi:hypothetical protein AVEN_94287-1 [Araneus ventricosus]|uniref:Uncharacterized protein n=1 Tax=Araneus ventricosus TaxID=182803 RepID=A0A4Y2IJQ2_ARAVE|nr:hypothetical protein AVEN_94287-1 [Araneus ventricosus]
MEQRQQSLKDAVGRLRMLQTAPPQTQLLCIQQPPTYVRVRYVFAYGSFVLCESPLALSVLFRQMSSSWCGAEVWRGGANSGVVLVI